MKDARRIRLIITATAAAPIAMSIVLLGCGRGGIPPQPPTSPTDDKLPTPEGTSPVSTPVRDETPTREAVEPPIIPGSELWLDVIVKGTGLRLSDVTFIVSIEYDPPLHVNNFSYTVFAEGRSPYRIPLTLPASPSRAVITATRERFLASDPLVIDSEFYHQRINPFREGRVSEFLLAHTFTMSPVTTTEAEG